MKKLKFFLINLVAFTTFLFYSCEAKEKVEEEEDSFAKYGQEFDGVIAKRYEDSTEWWPTLPKPAPGPPGR